jgi:CHAT domain-containing protein
LRILFASGIFLAICFFLQAGSAQVKTLANQNSVPENYLTDSESEAKALAHQWNGAALRRSADLYSELSELYRKSGRLEKSAEMLRKSAHSSFLLEDYEAASVNLKKSLLIEKTVSNSTGKIEALSLLTLVYLQMGQIETSEKHLNEGLELVKSINNPDVEADLYFSAAELKYARRKLDESITYAARAISLWQETRNPRREAETLRTLSFAYSGKDDLITAREKLQEALEKSRQAGDQRGEALAQFQLAYFYLIFNEPQKALETCQYSASLFPDDIDFIQKARIFNGISTIYEFYGDWKSALLYRQKTLELFRKGKYLSGELATLPSLIDISFKLGDEASAFRYFQTTAEVSGQLRDEFYLANANLFVADFYRKSSRDEKAIEYYKIALNYLSKLKYSTGISVINNDLGEIYLRQKQFSLARRHLEQSLKISRGNFDNFAEAKTLQNLAELSFLEGNDAQALNLVKESIRITDYLSSNTVNSRLKSSYLSNVFDRYELYIRLLMKMHRQSPDRNFALEALQAAEKSRARVMLETLSLAEADFTKDADAETVRHEKEIRVLLNTKADKLVDLLSNKAEKGEIDKLSNEIRELENELENIKARLKQQSPVYSAIKNPAPFDVAEFQQNILDENSLLLEFSLGTDESYLWIIGKREVASFILPPRAQIESDVEALGALLKTRELKPDESIEDFQKRIGDAEIQFQAGAKDLSQTLFGQLGGKLTGKRLIIVPDGALHYFPVAALPLPESVNGEPILLTNETVYEPSAQTLTVLAKSRRPAMPPKNLLVFSDPVFRSDDARFAAEAKSVENADAETPPADKFRFAESLNNLPRLAASKAESETITETVGAANIENYSGFAATREKLLSLKTDDYKILHFATHGMTDEERPELSGIVLSRFDAQGRKLKELFRIQDIYGLNLNADLVVLSACQTGIGKELKGEGLMSLNNAFLQTGAKSVMASLWKVEDGATLELMKNFYGALADERLTPSESLRRAQIKLRENPNYKSPFYWAAFTVQGDFRSVPQISGGWGFWVYLLPVPPLLLFGFYLYRRRKLHGSEFRLETLKTAVVMDVE